MIVNHMKMNYYVVIAATVYHSIHIKGTVNYGRYKYYGNSHFHLKGFPIYLWELPLAILYGS